MSSHDIIMIMSSYDVITMMSCMRSSLWGHSWHHKLLVQFLFLFSSFNHMHIIQHLPTSTYFHTLLYISTYFYMPPYSSTHLHTLLDMWIRLSSPSHLFHSSKTQHKTHTTLLSSKKFGSLHILSKINIKLQPNPLNFLSNYPNI